MVASIEPNCAESVCAKYGEVENGETEVVYKKLKQLSDTVIRRADRSTSTSVGRPAKDPQLLCPVTTTACVSDRESEGDKNLELRAYKLGKGKCSYNMVQIDLKNATKGVRRPLSAVETTEPRIEAKGHLPKGIAEGHLSYDLVLQNKKKFVLNVYIVYAEPASVKEETGAEAASEERKYSWRMVTRQACKKKCTGPILRAIQRFGKMGKRCSESWNNTSFDQEGSKQRNHLFIACDEACSHMAVPDKKTRFRFLFHLVNASDNSSVGSAVSPPIRVLANNDAPNGAAFIRTEIKTNLDKDLEAIDLGENDALAPQTPDHDDFQVPKKRKVEIVSPVSPTDQAVAQLAQVMRLQQEGQAQNALFPNQNNSNNSPPPQDIDSVRNSMTRAMQEWTHFQQAQLSSYMAYMQALSLLYGNRVWQPPQ